MRDLGLHGRAGLQNSFTTMCHRSCPPARYSLGMNRVTSAAVLALMTWFGSCMVAHNTDRAWRQFSFVKDRRPVNDETMEFGWAMDGPIVGGHGRKSSDGPPSEARQLEYTFKANYDRLVQAANREIISRGGMQTEGIGDHRWRLPENTTVTISPVRFEPSTGIDLDEKGWVRVTLHHHYRVDKKRLVRVMVRLVLGR